MIKKFWVLFWIGVSKTQMLDSFKAKINYYFFPWRTKEVILQKGSMWLAIGLVGKHGGVGREFDMRMNLKSLKTFSHANPWKKYYSRSNKRNNKKKSLIKLLIVLISTKQNTILFPMATLIHVGCRSDAKMFKTQVETQVSDFTFRCHFDDLLEYRP